MLRLLIEEIVLFKHSADKLSPALLLSKASHKWHPPQAEISVPKRDPLLVQLTGERDILHRWATGCGQDSWGSGGTFRTEWSSEQAVTREGHTCAKEFVLSWGQQTCSFGER